MNEKHEFQVGDLVRLKSVEEILALGFWFNEQGGISYPNKKEIMLLSNELKYCGKEFVVSDFCNFGHIELKSPNSGKRIVNICPSVLDFICDKADSIRGDFKVGDKIRIKTHEELLATDWSFDGETYQHLFADELIVKDMHEYLGKVHNIGERISDDMFKITSDKKKWNWDIHMVAELIKSDVQDTYEDCDFEEVIEVLEVKPGDKVRIKTHEELIETGWTFDGDLYYHDFDDEVIVKKMHKFLGEVYTVKDVKEGVITLEEGKGYWNWTSYMIAEVVEEDTYRDEEGNSFDPNSDYIEEEEYQPYCAVVDEMKPTTWDKDRIQRGFENLEMCIKGYDDGFQRALELMKKEFGVE